MLDYIDRFAKKEAPRLLLVYNNNNSVSLITLLAELFDNKGSNRTFVYVFIGLFN